MHRRERGGAGYTYYDCIEWLPAWDGHEENGRWEIKIAIGVLVDKQTGKISRANRRRHSTVAADGSNYSHYDTSTSRGGSAIGADSP